MPDSLRWLSLSAVLLTACHDGHAPDEPASVATVAVTGDSVLSPFESAPLQVVVTDSLGNTVTDRTVIWSSTDPLVAGVDTLGTVFARQDGVTYLKATVDGIGDSLAVRVTSSWRSVSAGEAAVCAVARDSTGYCWGAAYGSTSYVPFFPAPLEGGYHWRELDAGFQAACGVRTTGTTYCWGSTNHLGRLGVVDSVTYQYPSALIAQAQFAAISPGREHQCGVFADGSAACWGLNQHGEFGDSLITSPTDSSGVVGGHSWRMVAAGGFVSCGLTVTGAGYCWGEDAGGNLGLDTMDADVRFPRPVNGGHVFGTLTVGGAHQCGLVGEVAWCWGNDTYGQLGIGTTGLATYNSPQPVVGGHLFQQVSAGEFHSCALDDGGTAWCWGENYGGTPEEVPGHRFVTIDAGSSISCGLTQGGAAYCWGQGFRGDGRYQTRWSADPVRVRDP